MPISEKQNHIEQIHTPKTCEACKQTMPPLMLEIHQCPKKPALCEYCNAYIPSDMLQEHKEQCGSRTEVCPECSKYVKLRDFNSHLIDHSGRNFIQEEYIPQEGLLSRYQFSKPSEDIGSDEDERRLREAIMKSLEEH